MDNYTLEYESLIKMSDHYLFLSTWIDLKSIIFSEENSFWSNMYTKTTFMQRFKKCKTMAATLLFMNIYIFKVSKHDRE